MYIPHIYVYRHMYIIYICIYISNMYIYIYSTFHWYLPHRSQSLYDRDLTRGIQWTTRMEGLCHTSTCPNRSWICPSPTWPCRLYLWRVKHLGRKCGAKCGAKCKFGKFGKADSILFSKPTMVSTLEAARTSWSAWLWRFGQGRSADVTSAASYRGLRIPTSARFQAFLPSTFRSVLCHKLPKIAINS